jgi:hypothetical protein
MRALTQSAIASLLIAAPLAAQSYDPTLVPPQLIGSPATTTPLSLGDDNTIKVNLGFEFTYWGQTFTSAWVSSNGFVSFQSGDHLCCNGRPIDQAPRNTIYGFWTDLISGSNPYYARKENSILFGWYDTAEYGTQNKYTFEIGLSSDNKIRLNYGNMPPLTYHFATAGITGPGADDNIQLFYGRDPAALKYQSGVLAWQAPAASVDCAVTPLDPSCPPQIVAPVQTTTIATIQDAYAADVQADEAEVAVATVAEPAQEIETPVTEVQTETASVTERVAELVAAERLSPDQVASLAAPPPPVFASGPESAVSGVLVGPVQGSFGPTQTSSTSSALATVVETATSNSSPSSVANTLEVLNMSSAPAPQVSMAQSDQQTSNAMAEGQSDTIAAIAAVPGFSAYTQVALQDRPDFYAIRDIYRNRRLRDANFEMYRMTNTNTTKWQEMVNAQYGQ